MATDTTMRGFSRRIARVAAGIDAETTTLMRKTVLTVTSAVVLRTPVDTGRARSNWQTQIGSAPAGPVGAYTVGSKGSTEAAAVAQVMAQAQGEMARLTQRDTEVFLVNNLPYINRLDKGHSSQAASGFVKEAIAAGVRAINNARLVR